MSDTASSAEDTILLIAFLLGAAENARVKGNNSGAAVLV
jgi:hypothetical protein